MGYVKLGVEQPPLCETRLSAGSDVQRAVKTCCWGKSLIGITNPAVTDRCAGGVQSRHMDKHFLLLSQTKIPGNILSKCYFYLIRE